MELGDETTLYHPEKGEVAKSAIQKIQEKPYYQESSPWQPSRDLGLMSDEELRVFDKKKNAEMRFLVGKILGKSPKLADFSSQELTPMSERAAVAREAAVSYGGVRIMALKGQETIMSEYLGAEVDRRVWEFEPHPDFEIMVAKRNTAQTSSLKSTVERVSGADEDKLWHFLEISVGDIKRDEGVSLDIKNLTPFQAVYLIESLINKRMNYEYLIVGEDAGLAAEKIIVDGSTTSGQDLLELTDKDPKKLNKGVRKLERRIDKMSADELLDYQFGVCRHIAATTQKLFEVLKKRQDGLLMNGSYLVYHAERIGKQKEKRLFEHHAYNILVVTFPADSGGAEVSLSVLDPTWMINSHRDDYTYQRVSQAVSFLSEYGSDLGVENKDEVCENLAKQAAERLEKYMISNKTISLLDDYASLLIQSGKEARSTVIEKLKNVFINTNLNKVEFLNLLFETPSLSYSSEKGSRVIRSEYELKVAKEISHYNFYNMIYRDEAVLLRERVEGYVSGYDKIWLGIMKMNTPLTKMRMQKERNQSGFRMVNEYVRASVQLHEVPSEKMMKIVDDVVEIDTKAKLGLINKEWVDKLQALVLKNGAEKTKVE